MTPQNELSITVVVSHCLTLKLKFTVLELICGQKRYLKHHFDKLNMLAISVATKMSIALTRSDKKIHLRKMGIS